MQIACFVLDKNNTRLFFFWKGATNFGYRIWKAFHIKILEDACFSHFLKKVSCNLSALLNLLLVTCLCTVFLWWFHLFLGYYELVHIRNMCLKDCILNALVEHIRCNLLHFILVLTSFRFDLPCRIQKG
jgi:hypothetical protein